MSVLARLGMTKEGAKKPIAKAKSAGRKVPLNEVLARKYDEIAGVIKGSVGGDISDEDKAKISGFATVSKTNVKITPRVGGKIGAKLLVGEDGIDGDYWYTDDDMDKNKLEAVKAYTEIAAAIREEDKEFVALVDAARERNRAKKGNAK
jgi:hypothetical protein